MVSSKTKAQGQSQDHMNSTFMFYFLKKKKQTIKRKLATRIA